jgi:hypothetical protein
VCDGFIGNRMIEQYSRQAGFLLDEGCTPQQVDKAIEKFGFAMGPFRMGDLAGNDIGWAIRKRRATERADMKYSKTADKLCELGRFGQKTGAGWYDYQAGKRDAIPNAELVNKMIEDHRNRWASRRARFQTKKSCSAWCSPGQRSRAHSGRRHCRPGQRHRHGVPLWLWLPSAPRRPHAVRRPGGPVQRGAGHAALPAQNPLDDASSGSRRPCWPSWWLKARASTKLKRGIMIKRVAHRLRAWWLLLVAVLVAINTCARAHARSAYRLWHRLWRWTRKAWRSGWAGPSASRPSPASTTPTLNAEFRKLHDYLQQRYPKDPRHAQARAGGWAEPALHLARHRPCGQAHPADGTPGRGARVARHREQMGCAPFSGEVKDGYVWGRGSWDDKGNLIAQMEAVEMLVASGFKPARRFTWPLAMTRKSAASAVRLRSQSCCSQRGVKLDFVLDEGLLITDGIMPGLAKPAALIGIAEKGFLSVVLKVPATPGHSSMPPPKGSSAIGMMSAALRRLDDEQLPAGIRGVAREMFETMAPRWAASSGWRCPTCGCLARWCRRNWKRAPAPTPCCAPPRRSPS